jgi:hypothetical protein
LALWINSAIRMVWPSTICSLAAGWGFCLRLDSVADCAVEGLP